MVRQTGVVVLLSVKIVLMFRLEVCLRGKEVTLQIEKKYPSLAR